MKSIKEKIEVMQAYDEGKEIQFKSKIDFDEWTNVTNVTNVPWNWQDFEHRIKPQYKKTDWSKVAKGTAVLVRDSDNEKWVKSYFHHIIDMGCDFHYTVMEQNNGITDWKYCKLDTQAKSIIVWIPNIGDKPSYKNVLVKDSHGDIFYRSVESLSWDLKNDLVKFYAIID